MAKRIHVSGYLDAEDYDLDGSAREVPGGTYDEIVGIGDFENKGLAVIDLEDLEITIEEA